MKLKNVMTKVLLMVIGSMVLATSLSAKDVNILAYIDRGIKYYPKYVKRGFVKFGKASWYGKPFHRRLTANGERYNMYNMTAAHRTYAMNTVLKVTSLDTKKSVRVRINDRGPFYSSRDIDLSYGAAKKIGLTKKGVGRVKIEVISEPKSKRRKYSVKAKRSLRKKHLAKKHSRKRHLVKKKHVVKKHTIKKLARKKTDTKQAKIQVASFYNMKRAKTFKKNHNLKNAIIVKRHIASTNKTTYKVVLKCSTKEAKKILKSKKFSGAYIYPQA